MSKLYKSINNYNYFMKQKTTTLLLCTVIGITVGAFVINSHETNNVNTLLMQNVEASADNESNNLFGEFV